MTIKTKEDLESLISQALKKIKGKRENDLCKFLPVETGGYMHHFTLRKMKTQEPKRLAEMIQSHVLSKGDPKRVPHKPRRPRGSRKRHDVIALTRGELDQILQHVRGAGDQEMAAKLSPRRSLAQLKRQLVASIRRNTVDIELWSSYVDAIRSTQEPNAGYSAGQVLLAATPNV